MSRFALQSCICFVAANLAGCGSATEEPGDDGGASEGGGDGIYTLSGTLQGLQGATVVLTQANGDELTLDANGTFEFPTRLGDQEGYEVLVQTQPIDPDQTCEVTLGSGAIDGASVGELVVDCVTPIRHVVILGIDGLGGLFVEEADMPNLDALMEEGTWTLSMQNALPTSSSTNWMSMIGGTSPDQHGVLNNAWQPGDSNPPPTLFAVVRGQRPDAKSGMFHDWQDFDRLVEEGVVDRRQHPGDEQETMDAALAWADANAPELLFIHLDHVDHAGHLNTWGSDAYFASAKVADDLVGQLRAGLESNGMWPYTALLVSSDHGGAGFSHGADTTPERPIPFVARTPQGQPTAITRETRIWDIAATAAALLEVTPPPEWVASPVIEVWGPIEAPVEDPLPQVEVETLELVYTDDGTGSFSSVSFWRPSVPAGYVSLGDIPADSYTSPMVTGYAVAADHPAVTSPRGYEKIWSDDGANGNMMVTLWNPVPPAGYVCPGQIAKADYGEPPALDELACVRQEYVKLSGVEFVWDDTGSGATWDGSVWGCAPAGEGTLVHPTFLSRRHHDGPGYGECMGLVESMTTSAGG